MEAQFIACGNGGKCPSPIYRKIPESWILAETQRIGLSSFSFFDSNGSLTFHHCHRRVRMTILSNLDYRNRKDAVTNRPMLFSRVSMNYRRNYYWLLAARSMFLGFFLALAFALTGSIFSISAKAANADLAGLLRGVEERYNRPKTLRLHFHQIYKQSGQVLRDEIGTLYLMKPGKMRWEYEGTEQKLFLSDGRRVIFYLPTERRLTETAVKESDDLRNPIRFLLGGLKFQKEFERVDKVNDIAPLEPGNVVIRGVPKLMKDRLESVVMELSSQFEIRRLILAEPGGVLTDFRFSNETSNMRISPELFKFTPPQGTEIIKD
jgi:outer membrane lipoprotein carrier protein